MSISSCKNLLTCAFLVAALTACSGGSSGPGAVTQLPPVGNLAPVAKADQIAVAPGGTAEILVLANDSDPENAPLELLDVDPAPAGAALVMDNGSPADRSDDYLIYTAPADFEGTVRFGYTIGDSGGSQARAQILVYIEHPVPTATEDHASTLPDSPVVIHPLDNDAGNAAWPIAVSEITAASNGTVTLDDNGTPEPGDDSLLYLPDHGFAGTDSFLYSISDGVSGATATVTVAVAPAGQMPDERTVGGLVQKGPMARARISIFALNQAGERTSPMPLAQTMSASDGTWQARVTEAVGDLLIVSAGGSYEDEADAPGTGRRRLIRYDNDQILEAVLPAGENFAALTPYSSALLVHARHTAVGNNFAVALAGSRQQFAGSLGFDPIATIPADPIAPELTTELDSRLYAMANGGFSNALNSAAVLLGMKAPDHALAVAMIRDLADCTLDGRDRAGPVMVTVRSAPLPLPGTLDLNGQILRFRNNNADAYAGTPIAAFNPMRCQTPVVLVDAVPPVINLLGANPMTVVSGNAFADPGFNATDNVDGDVSSSVVVTGSVNTAVPGVYLLAYNVSDMAGNDAAEAIRTVRVEAVGVPVVSLIGGAAMILEAGDDFVDPGASATDTEDGDLTGAVTVGGSVDNLVPGIYLLRYDVSDSDGNVASTAIRTVTVVDSTPPTLVLTGSNPVSLSEGSAYVDAGATATDIVDGDVSAAIAVVDTVNTSVPGTYVINYSVSDSAGNVATASRTVIVVASGTPTITLTGAATVSVEATTVYVDAGATAADDEDGDLTAEISVINPVDTFTPGTYEVWYDVSDSDGNSAPRVTRVVQVLDTTAPVIALSGADPVTVEAGDAYVDDGATASDTVDGDLTGAIVTVNPVNTAAPGTYTITYNVSDAAGNAAAQVTRTVDVVDTTAPVIALLGSDPDVVAIGSGPYVDPGFTASDAYEGDLTGSVTTTGSVDTTTAGTYTLFYDVSDTAGNPALTVSRSVVVQTAAESSDADGDGLSDAIEQKITGSASAVQALTVFIDPDPAITVRDGTTWATAYAGIDDLVAANGGFLPQGLSATQPTYIVLGDNSAAPATGANPDRWQLIVSNGNCSHIAVIGSLESGTIHPGTGLSEPSTLLNAPGSQVLNANNCANLQFHNLQFVDSGGPAVAEGGAVRISNAWAIFDQVIFDNNEARDAGGALMVRNSFTPTQVLNSIFRDNDVDSGTGIGGGAIYLANNALIDIANSRFEGNDAKPGSGGALYAVQNAAFDIDRSVFVGNSVTLDGGAVFIERNNVSGNSTISHSLFSGNEADREGGAIRLYCNDFSPPMHIFDNLLSGNGAVRGGAIAIDDCDAIEIDNNSIVMNEATAASGGGAIHVDTVSTAVPTNARPMPELYDNILFGNIDAGGPSVYSINNLPSWGQQYSHENLMDMAADASSKDVLLTDYTMEFDAGWYLQPGSQAVDLSSTNASNANKFQSAPNRTTAVSGAADLAKADGGYHYETGYGLAPVTAVAASSLEANRNGGQGARIRLIDSNGDPAGSGHRVALEVAAGSAAVALSLSSSATFPSAPGATVATDRGDGDYEIEVETLGVFAPDSVLLDVYVDDVFLNQVSISIDP